MVHHGKKSKLGHIKDGKIYELSSERKLKERSSKKKRSEGGEVVDGKVKKKKKKRKEEVKQLRSMMKTAAKAVLNAKKSKGRKLVLRACNMAVKAEKRKQTLSKETISEVDIAEAHGMERKSKDSGRGAPSRTEVVPVKRGVGRPRKVDIRTQQSEHLEETSKHKDRKSVRKSRSRRNNVELTGTKSWETRLHTRSSSRAASPPKMFPTKVSTGNIDFRTSESSVKPSKKDRTESSSKKSRKKDKLRKSLEKRAGKSTRSGLKLYHIESPGRYDKVHSSQETSNVHRTRSLPDLKTVKGSSSTIKRKIPSSLRRMAAAVKKTAKKIAAVTPVLPPVEKKGRGRPPGEIFLK